MQLFPPETCDGRGCRAAAVFTGGHGDGGGGYGVMEAVVVDVEVVGVIMEDGGDYGGCR